MRRRLILAIFLFLLSGLSFLGIKLLNDRRQFTAFGALQVMATPKSQVYLNGQLLGETPYFSDKLNPGEQTIKIVPFENSANFFEQKIKLAPLLLTAVDRTFRETPQRNEGIILALEPLPDKAATELVVLSTPSEAKVFLNNDLKGVTPLDLKEIPVSEHELFLTLTGFIDKRTRINVSPGYKLVADVKLAVSLEVSPSATPILIPTPAASQSAKIKQTPTGFLRVRFSPTLRATEVAQVKPGETFPILEEVEGWTKILLPGGQTGWASNLYLLKP